MAHTLSVATLNVNGMRDHRKRSRIFQYCKSMEVDCVCLQETHILEEDVPLWAYEWGGELHASFGSSSSCGTVILLSARQAGCATRVETDHEGRLVCILFKYPQGNIAICNVYAPNRPSARRDFFNTLPSFVPGSAPCVMVGDFNCVPDSGLDRLGTSVSASPDAGITELDRFTSAHLLADVWRHMHPCSTVYTWVRPNGEDASRIDRVYAPTYLDEKYHGARVRARVEAVEAEERPSLRFYQSVSSSAGDRRVPSVALLMGPCLGTPWIPNKRPITLLNVDYKLLAKALCNRLALAMPHLVGDLQTCAVKGHCIQQNLWLMRDLTDFVIERDLPCALVSLDQQKAFDMVDRGFLMNVLETFQLHPFRKWISVLYQESFSSVIVNGFCSEVFNVERGVAGCPLSPLLYVLFSESLSRLLERDSRLVPFVVPGGAKVKCAQYADDVTCVVSSLGSFRALSQDLSIFERATGAKLNPEKTKGLRLGSWRYRDLPFGASWSDQNIKINGIWFGYDAPCDVTWSERAEVFERTRNLWHPLAFDLGKVTVINRFVSPILWYPGAVYQFRVASWCGWRGRFFIHMVWWYRACQEGGIVPKTGEGGTRGGSSGK
ncbi:hypothetical protein BSL78_19917 [Apostichopus japonicus]|uniref:Pol-like protein n=1 Tax=Stichopus japonicus TaxID=307972 RepID=A0A2G8K5D1_STIJA|nr:hypothetical protein BSL78_19917 [Apostichopus japonicus]